MNILTLTITVSAPRELVFNFLADVESLPKWSGGYCESIALRRGGWWAFTADGEQVVAIDSNADAGVIDVRAGPTSERMTLTPIRVVALSARHTLVSFVLIEAPDRGPEVFERRCRIWREAVKGLLNRFGGGELHTPDTTPHLMELGLN
jgi:hypothetical protein